MLTLLLGPFWFDRLCADRWHLQGSSAEARTTGGAGRGGQGSGPSAETDAKAAGEEAGNRGSLGVPAVPGVGVPDAHDHNSVLQHDRCSRVRLPLLVAPDHIAARANSDRQLLVMCRLQVSSQLPVKCLHASSSSIGFRF